MITWSNRVRNKVISPFERKHKYQYKLYNMIARYKQKQKCTKCVFNFETKEG